MIRLISFVIFISIFFFQHIVLSQIQEEYMYGRSDSLKGKLSTIRSCFDVTYYDLSFELNKTYITGENNIHFSTKSPTQIIQIDLFKQYIIPKILCNGVALKFDREYNAVFVHFPFVLQKDSNYSIHVFYEGKTSKAQRPPWVGGLVSKKDENGNPWVSMACEQLGASSWWPCKDHWSDEADSMKISIRVPSNLTAISNGNLLFIKEEKALNKKTYVWKISNPINNYNVSFYIGDYQHFSDTLISPHGKLAMDYYVLPYNLSKAKTLFKQCNEVLNFYEEMFGKYPFNEDGFGMVESPFEGIEHQGAIAYGASYNNTKFYRTKIYDYIILHEIAHEWWGNSVTVDDIADLWIHEGLATHAEMLFLERKFGKQEYLYELRVRSSILTNSFPLIGIRDVNYNFTYNTDIYLKGAQVLHNLRCCINDDSLFFKVLKSFCEQNQKSIVNSEKFIAHVKELTQRDFIPFFKTWLQRRLPPELAYSYEIRNKEVLFTYQWKNVAPGFEMPFSITIDNQTSMRLIGSEIAQKILLKDVKELIQIPKMIPEENKFIPFNGSTYFKFNGDGRFYYPGFN